MERVFLAIEVWGDLSQQLPKKIQLDKVVDLRIMGISLGPYSILPTRQVGGQTPED